MAHVGIFGCAVPDILSSTGHSRIRKPEIRCSALLTVNRNGFLSKLLSERNEHIFNIFKVLCVHSSAADSQTRTYKTTQYSSSRGHVSHSLAVLLLGPFKADRVVPCPKSFFRMCAVDPNKIVAGMMRSLVRACIIETGGHPNAPTASAMAKTPMMHSLFMLFWLPLLSICQCSFGQGTSLD